MPCLHSILTLCSSLDESVSEFGSQVLSGIADDLLQHFIDDGCHLLGNLLNVTLPILNLAPIGLFLGLLSVYLLLDE